MSIFLLFMHICHLASVVNVLISACQLMTLGSAGTLVMQKLSLYLIVTYRSGLGQADFLSPGRRFILL